MLRPFSVSPSYQSELSDCSFFPPTHSSNTRRYPPYYSPMADIIPEAEETMSTSLDLLLTSDKYYYHSNQLCPCAMEPSGSCPSCARALSFSLSPINFSSLYQDQENIQIEKQKNKFWKKIKFQSPSCFHIYFTLGKNVKYLYFLW